MTGPPFILFASIRVFIDSLPPKCECNMGMRTKFLFKLIYNGNIFPAFRKVIPSLSYSEIEATKALGSKFWKNHSAVWPETEFLEISWTILKTQWWEVFVGFWEFTQLKHLVEIYYCWFGHKIKFSFNYHYLFLLKKQNQYAQNWSLECQLGASILYQDQC